MFPEKNPKIRLGKIFGSSIHNASIEFNDSHIRNFDFSFYLCGVVVHSSDENLETYSFVYRTSNGTFLQSQLHGSYFSVSGEQRHEEKLNEVAGYIQHKMITGEDGSFNRTVINRLTLYQTYFPLHRITSEREGQLFRESFKGYHIGYVTGRFDEYIEQIQFVWFRDEEYLS